MKLSLKNLPLRVSNLEQKFVEFVAKTEAVIGGSLPAQCGVVCNTACMYCILIDAHLSDGAQLAMHDVFSLRGIDPFKVSTRVSVSTHSLIMYVLHSYRCPPL